MTLGRSHVVDRLVQPLVIVEVDETVERQGVRLSPVPWNLKRRPSVSPLPLGGSDEVSVTPSVRRDRHVEATPIARHRERPRDPVPLPEQVEVPLHQLAGAVREGLLAFSVGIGLQVMALMMDEELTEIVGPKGKHNADRSARRHGSEIGSAVLGGRKTSVTRPRARYLDGSGEV